MLLPEPLGPMMACTSPAPTVRSRPRRIGSGSHRETELASTTGATQRSSTRNSSLARRSLRAAAGNYPYRRSANWQAAPSGVTQVFLPGAEAVVGGPARPGAVGSPVGEQAQRVRRGQCRRPGRPSTGRRRPAAGPGPPQQPRPDAPLVLGDRPAGQVVAQAAAVGRCLDPRRRRDVAVADRRRRQVDRCGRACRRPAARRTSRRRRSADEGRQRLCRITSVTNRGSIHSSRCGRSAPIVVSTPWPGRTTVASGNVNSRSSIERMIVGKSASWNLCCPGPPGNSVSPVNSSGVPRTANEIEPGVWPGLWMASRRSSPTSITSASSRNTS